MQVIKLQNFQYKLSSNYKTFNRNKKIKNFNASYIKSQILRTNDYKIINLTILIIKLQKKLIQKYIYCV